jgi:hypothetical protein
LDVELPEGVTGGIARLTHGLDIYVGQTVEADGWWRPVLFTSDGTADVQFWEDLGVAGPFSPQADPPRLFSVSPTGSTIAWVQSGQLFIADGRTFDIPDGSKVIELDMTDDFIALSRASTPASLLDLRTGEWYDSPALGRLTISFRDPGTPSEPVPTTSEAPPVSEPAAVVTAGSDGVWEQASEGWVQWTSEPMAVAVKAPNGWMIMQRVDKYADGSTPADTLPLVVRSPGDAPEGLFDIVFPGADVVPGRYEVHDAATIGGRPTLIYERQAAESTGLDTPQGSLFALDLDSGYFQVISDNFGGWEQGSSRMHLGETGLIVGESSSGISHALTSFHIYGGIPLEPADMGFDADYADCTDCPRLFSLSRDGMTFAWLDGSTLRRWDLEHGEALPPVELGDEVLAASDLTVTDDYVVIDRAWYGQEAPPILIPLDGSSPTELKGLHAT